jgi:uncharacterized protein
MPDFVKALKQLRPRRSSQLRVDTSDNPVSSLARQLSFLKSRLPFLLPEPSSIEGDEEITELGRHLVIRNSYDDAQYHGKVRLARFALADLQRFVTVMKHKATAADRDGIVFLDTETTGLQGGTGMVPFLVGLGFFQGDTFHTAQYFIRDFDEEPSMLLALGEFLRRFNLLITYNGMAFDVPLLETRFTMARLNSPLTNLPHLDLLPGARRLWRNGHGSCRLVALEQKIVAFLRGPDIPGGMIPQTYFDFLQGKGVAVMAKVLKHNFHDIVSLAALTVCACDRVSGDPAELDDPLDLYSLARVMEHTTEWKRALDLYEMALRGDLPQPFLVKASENLAVLSRRAGNHERALSLCEDLMNHSDFSMVGYESAAIHYERREGDAHRALEIVERALDRLKDAPAANRRWLAALQSRRDRLMEKWGQTTLAN